MRNKFLLSTPDCVDECKLHQRRENETDATQEPDFTGFDVGDLRQGFGL